jgi:hypothetical protein
LRSRLVRQVDSVRACSACSGDYEDPEESVWDDPSEEDAGEPDVENAEQPEAREEFPVREKREQGRRRRDGEKSGEEEGTNGGANAA